MEKINQDQEIQRKQDKKGKLQNQGSKQKENLKSSN